MVDASRIKAMQTRVARLSEAFEKEHGRTPKVSEINELVKEEMRAQQKKSRESYVANGSKGGFRGMSKERMEEIRAQALETRRLNKLKRGK